MAFFTHSGNDKSHLTLGYERYRHSSAPPRWARYYVKWLSVGRNIFDMQLFAQNEKYPIQSWMWVIAERPFGGEPICSIGGLTATPSTTRIAQTAVATKTVSAVLRKSPGNGRTNNRNVIFISYGLHFSIKTASRRKNKHHRLGFVGRVPVGDGAILQVAGPGESSLFSICGLQL
jgi:hypothetical protein